MLHCLTLLYTPAYLTACKPHKQVSHLLRVLRFAVTAVENLHSPNSTNVISSVCLRRVPLAASLNLSSEHHPVTTPQQPGSVILSPRAYSVHRRTICCTHTPTPVCSVV